MDPTEQATKIISDLPGQILESLIMWIKIFWDLFVEILIKNWLFVLFFTVLILVIAIVKLITMGRWGMLTSILYRIFYFGILFVVILVFGAEIIVTDSFQALAGIIGVIIFEIIGFFIRKLKFIKK